MKKKETPVFAEESIRQPLPPRSSCPCRVRVRVTHDTDSIHPPTRHKNQGRCSAAATV